MSSNEFCAQRPVFKMTLKLIQVFGDDHGHTHKLFLVTVYYNTNSYLIIFMYNKKPTSTKLKKNLSKTLSFNNGEYDAK